MATYYYADVRRFQAEESALRVLYLEDTPLITANPHKTNTKYYVYYVIDVYASSISTFSAWKTALTNNSSTKGTLVSPNSGTNEDNGLANGLTINVTVNKGTTDTNVKVGDLTNDNSHQKVSFSRLSKTTNGQVVATPTVNIQWKSDASPNWTKITAGNINWRTKDNVVPSITWTTTVTAPVFPLVAIQTAFKNLYPSLQTPVLQKNTQVAENQITIMASYCWDKCTNLWHFVIHYGAGNYDEYWTCEKNGGDVKVKRSPSAAIKASKKDLATWTKNNVTNPMIAAKSNANCGDGTSNGTQKDITEVAPPAGDTRYNPPPHREARGPSLSERLKYGSASDSFNTLPAFAKKERGRIFQDVNGAAILNKNPDKLKDLVSAKGTGNLWGFRFMYNPTTISYSTASNNSVDWTLGQSDPATLLAGNQTVTFEVYINRIPDLKYLRMKNPKVTEKEIYLRDLTLTEKEGILNRGTEYDIEFLYRVLNGDPLKNSLLLSYTGSSNAPAATSDFGYTTGVPCWLVLNENLRYFGSVASFQVNHAMFDSNMVPMLSTVSISFTRYPALWNETAAFGTGASANSIKNYLSNTGNTTGTGVNAP